MTYPTREINYTTSRAQGQRAYRAGRPLTENPYPKGSTQHHGFTDGWMLAQRQTPQKEK